MEKKIVWLVVSCLMALSLILASCAPAVVEEEKEEVVEEEVAEKELGIPTLQLEGKQWDTSYAGEATITAKLDEFAQMCLSRKGLS